MDGTTVAYPAAGGLKTKGTLYRRIEFKISVYVDAMVRRWVPYKMGLQDMRDFFDTRAERMLSIDVVALVVLDNSGALQTIDYESARLIRIMWPRTNPVDQTIEWEPGNLVESVELLTTK